MITRKLGAALAAGCTAVIKPPAETPFSCLALVEVCCLTSPITLHTIDSMKLANRAGIPAGVINVVTTHANIADVGRELCENPIIKKVSFTGSTPVAKMLYKYAAGTMKK